MTSSKREPDAPAWQRVESTLMVTARAIRQAYDRRLARLELNLSQASLLAFVQDWGPQTQTQLADRLGLGRAATGSVVDVLERRGLVARQRDSRDRRVWRVEATQQGRDVAKPITEIDQVLRRELRAGISREERQQLAQLLLRLQSNLASVLAEDEE
jgi:MarR family transcriptional regulator for hemolysin